MTCIMYLKEHWKLLKRNLINKRRRIIWGNRKEDKFFRYKSIIFNIFEMLSIIILVKVYKNLYYNRKNDLFFLLL